MNFAPVTEPARLFESALKSWAEIVNVCEESQNASNTHKGWIFMGKTGICNGNETETQRADKG